MKKAGILMFCLLVAMVLSGCGERDIEAQAYAVSLGIDLQADGQICVSVQVPALNQAGSSETGSEEGGGGKGYTFSSASGQTLTEALEMLHATLPRALNLTGVKSVVISEETARSERFMEVLHEMALSYRVYGAAELIVCQGEARAFIQDQQAVIGLRLSESTTVALRHYHEIGCIPSAKTADVYYMSRSVYGDPAAAYAAINADEESGGNDLAGDLSRSGDNKNLYFGSVLFREGRMVGVLTGEQTQLLNVLRGELKDFSRIRGGVPMRLRVSSGPGVSVDLSEERAVIDVKLTVDVMDAEQKADTGAIAVELQERLDELTAYCQELGTDPFRYAEKAAGQFATIGEWQKYGWRERFSGAEVRYRVEVKRAEY